MNSVSTANLFGEEPISQAPATAIWRETHERIPERALGLSRMVKVAGLFAFLLAVSPITTILDPWLIERKRRDSAVTGSAYQEVIGRFISRSETLRISREILKQAEQERLAAAEFEAARGIQWADQP